MTTTQHGQHGTYHKGAYYPNLSAQEHVQQQPPTPTTTSPLTTAFNNAMSGDDTDNYQPTTSSKPVYGPTLNSPYHQFYDMHTGQPLHLEGHDDNAAPVVVVVKTSKTSSLAPQHQPTTATSTSPTMRRPNHHGPFAPPPNSASFPSPLSHHYDQQPQHANPMSYSSYSTSQQPLMEHYPIPNPPETVTMNSVGGDRSSSSFQQPYTGLPPINAPRDVNEYYTAMLQIQQQFEYVTRLYEQQLLMQQHHSSALYEAAQQLHSSMVGGPTHTTSSQPHHDALHPAEEEQCNCVYCTTVQQGCAPLMPLSIVSSPMPLTVDVTPKRSTRHPSSMSDEMPLIETTSATINDKDAPRTNSKRNSNGTVIPTTTFYTTPSSSNSKTQPMSNSKLRSMYTTPNARGPHSTTRAQQAVPQSSHPSVSTTKKQQQPYNSQTGSPSSAVDMAMMETPKSNATVKHRTSDMVSTPNNNSVPFSTTSNKTSTPSSAYNSFLVDVVGHNDRRFTVISHIDLKEGAYIVYEGDRGVDMGKVCKVSPTRTDGGTTKPSSLPMVIRNASEIEIRNWTTALVTDAEEAVRGCTESAAQLHLNMEIRSASYQMDRHKLTFFYSSPDERVDFRKLLPEMFTKFRCRIWMERDNSGH